MEISVYRKIFSYIFDVPLERRTSPLSGELTVSIHKGQYKLSTQEAIYSFGNRYSSFSTAFKALDTNNKPIESVLVLGFGLGSVVDLLKKNTTIQSIIALDVDPVVIDLAKKYLNSATHQKIEFLCADATEFMQQRKEKFDLVIFDVFVGDKTPLQFMQQACLVQLKSLVKSKGMLLYSKLEDSQHQKMENNQFSSKFSEVYSDAFSIATEGNRIFVWMNN